MANKFISECIDCRSLVVVYTMNGFQMRGKIIDECDSYIIISCGNSMKMVYKHAISTIEVV